MKRARKKATNGDPRKPGCDGNPPILVDVQGITAAERKAKVTLKRNMAENPVDRMFHKGLISPIEREAGMRLLKDWELSQTSTMRGMDYAAERVCCSGGQAGLSDARCDAMTRLNKALHVVGPISSMVLTAVVIDGEDFQSLAARRRWNRNGIGLVVAAALGALAVHYRVGVTDKAA